MSISLTKLDSKLTPFIFVLIKTTSLASYTAKLEIILMNNLKNFMHSFTTVKPIINQSFLRFYKRLNINNLRQKLTRL